MTTLMGGQNNLDAAARWSNPIWLF